MTTFLPTILHNYNNLSIGAPLGGLTNTKYVLLYKSEQKKGIRGYEN